MGPDEARGGRRLAAIFAADVAGYSRLMGQDDAGTVRALTAARATLGHLIAGHGGRLVNTVGDSVLAEFPSAIDAVRSALAVQARLSELDAEATGPRLAFRIAVHVGDVLSSGTDIYGDGVNVCARLQEFAEPGGVCISDAAYRYVRKALPIEVNDLGERTLKNIDEPVRVYAIRPARAAEHSPPQRKPFAAPPPLRANPRTIGWIAAGGLAGALATVLAYQFATQPGTPPAQPSGVEAAKAAASLPTGAITVAVLPFANLSGDASQEFFSDGMTEEITSALARVPDLRVVARTSAFEFKGQNRNIRTLGEQLGASHLIEGSIRKAGERVRITVQLINAADGTHVWSENYDRELTDIFAIQEDIARTITTSLRMPLGLSPGENLVNNRNIDPAGYQEYLRARALVLSRGQGPAEAVKILEPLVARYPDFAPAWIQLAWAHTFSGLPGRNTLSTAEWRSVLEAVSAKSEMAARRALALDADIPDTYVILGIWSSERGGLVQADEHCSRAFALDPGHSEALHQCAIFKAMEGRLKEALAMRMQLRASEPFVPVYNRGMANVLWLNGQDDTAIALFNQDPMGDNTEIQLARIYAAAGRYAVAADTLQGINPNAHPPGVLAEAIRLLRIAPTKVTSPPTLPRLGILGFVYLHVGAPERVLDFYEDGAWIPPDVSLFWHPSYAPVRKMDRFKSFVRQIGLVDYWRAKGWADLCRPIGADDFVCD